MPLVSHRMVVDAPAALLWRLLKDKVENPRNYVPGVVGSEILRRAGDSIERRLHVRGDRGARSIREIVTVDGATMTVLFKLVEDPHYSGIVTNTVYEEDGKVEFESTMGWRRRQRLGAKDDGADLDWDRLVQSSVFKMKEMAEAAARRERNS